MAGSDKGRRKKQAENRMEKKVAFGRGGGFGPDRMRSRGKSALTEENGENDVVLTALVQQAVTADAGIWEGWAARKLYEDTNIKIEFYPPGPEWSRS